MRGRISQKGRKRYHTMYTVPAGSHDVFLAIRGQDSQRTDDIGKHILLYIRFSLYKRRKRFKITENNTGAIIFIFGNILTYNYTTRALLFCIL